MGYGFGTALIRAKVLFHTTFSVSAPTMIEEVEIPRLG
jgi:hypothetical protein